jgi:hypothetical protein
LLARVQSENSNETILDFQTARNLRIEVETLVSLYGPSAYSQYLQKHGSRPDPETAAAIGRLIGGRVRADDGSMQPPLSAADRRLLKEIRARRKAAARRYEQLIQLQNAIAALAEINDDPATLIGDGSCVLNAPAVVAQLDPALSYLKRFAEHWNDRANSKDDNGLGSSHK